MSCELKKIVNYNKCSEFVDKKGKGFVAPQVLYAVEVNGKTIFIKPVFKEDYDKFDLLANLVVIGDKNNKKMK